MTSILLTSTGTRKRLKWISLRRGQCVISLISAVGSLGVASACSETHKAPAADPRAYRGSDRSVTLSVALAKCDLQVPATSSGLNYYTKKGWDGLLFLVKFTTNRAGYRAFLKSADLADDDLVTADSSPFDVDGARVGWRFDAERRYAQGGATRDSPPYPTYSLAVDVTDSASPTIYMQCTTD